MLQQVVKLITERFFSCDLATLPHFVPVPFCTLGNSLAATMTTALGFRVRVDAAQSFDATQQAQGRANIGAASATDVTTLTTDLGDLSTDFYAAYNAAKA